MSEDILLFLFYVSHIFNFWATFFSVYMEEDKGMFICMLCLQCLVYLCPKQNLLNAIRSGEYKFWAQLETLICKP